MGVNSRIQRQASVGEILTYYYPKGLKAQKVEVLRHLWTLTDYDATRRFLCSFRLKGCL